MSEFPYTPFPFNVTAASPLFRLSPTASNISQGWVPSCSTPECVPTASWSTGSVGASMSFQFWGWDVAFDGDIKGNMSIELVRDGGKETWNPNPSDDALFRLRGKPTDGFDLHNITLRVLDASPDAELTIKQAQVNGSSFGDIIWNSDRWIIPSNDTRLSYMGFVQQKSAVQVGPGSQTTYVSSKVGDTMSTQFNGSTLLIHGPCGPGNGLMRVKIDDRESTVNTSKPISSDDCLLFQAWGFPRTKMHQLLVENADGATLGINRIEFFLIYPPSNRRSDRSVLVVGVVLIVVFSVLALVVITWKTTKRKEKVRKSKVVDL